MPSSAVQRRPAPSKAVQSRPVDLIGRTTDLIGWTAAGRPSRFGRPAPDGFIKEPGRPPDGRRTDLDGAGRRWTALDG